jgi:hypothetical protein
MSAVGASGHSRSRFSEAGVRHGEARYHHHGGGHRYWASHGLRVDLSEGQVDWAQSEEQQQ